MGVFASAGAAPLHDPEELRTALAPFFELEPFLVEGEELSVSVYARSSGDRRYAERFAESVVEVAYKTIGRSTGHGLIIVGDRDEPHPIFVFRRFLQMQSDNPQPGAMAEAADALRAQLEEWKTKIDINVSGKDAEAMSLDFDVILNAMPLPLEGVGSTLYLVAWSEAFDQQKVDRRLRTFESADLERNEFSRYDWIFYLPPRSAFKKALKEIVPAVLKESEMGFVKRAAVRSALFTFKPAINDAIEGLRKGMLFFTVLHAKSEFPAGDNEALAEAYIGALMPRGRIIPGDKQERALEAIEAQKAANLEYAKDPFISPTPLENPNLDAYSKFEVEFGSAKEPTHRFTIRDGNCYWQYRERDPGRFQPAGDSLFVSEDGTMTIEFLLDDRGEVSAVRERWERREYTIPRWRDG